MIEWHKSGKERELVGQKTGGDRRSEKSIGKICLLKTDAQLAEEHKVAVRTIKNDAAFAKAVDAIAEVSPEAKQAIFPSDAKIAREDVKALVNIAKDSPQAAKNVLDAVEAWWAEHQVCRLPFLCASIPVDAVHLYRSHHHCVCQ